MRVRQTNEQPLRMDRSFVLYWMTAARRASWNFSLDRAEEWAKDLDKPLVVFEGLRDDYPWKSDRIDGFVRAGMAENERAFDALSVRYLNEGRLVDLAADAAVVVTDEFPCFFLPRMLAAAAEKLDVRLEAVDSNGILPMAAAERAFTTAHSFRRFLQKELPNWLGERPKKRRNPATRARKAWRAFRDERFGAYPDDRNRPEKDGASGLSPHLHFGHISPHEILHDVFAREEWDPGRLSPETKGSRTGWWGLSEAAEAFLDQLITWRELGYNRCWLDPEGYDKYETLPEWALETLELHADDPREHVYSLAEFEEAGTHDELWNAAQRQLVSEGRMHNYLRMLWGKKILEWSGTPREALATMVELNNKYALDGRNPNSYSGIFWVLGRYDRPWGPERPVFGKVRYMSSQNTARKFPVKGYLQRYSSF